MGAYSSVLDRAIALAARAHETQLRKGSKVPYIHHPVMVGMVLARAGFDDEVVVAGILHDVVEDQDVTLEEIDAQFGGTIAHLVGDVTEQKTEAGSDEKRPWRTRKEEQLEHLRHMSVAGAAVKAADALHNCLCTVSDYDREGTTVWTRFNAGRADQVWYYSSVSRLVRERLGDHPLALELEAAVARLLACEG